MPAEVLLSALTASQEPSAISLVKVNSSVEITCSTSLPEPMGFSLHKSVSGNIEVVYLDFQDGEVNRKNIMPEFEGRIQIPRDKQVKGRYRLTLQLSQLRLEDTDYYYCNWMHMNSKTYEHEVLASNGTVIIVTDKTPQKQCNTPVTDLILIALTVTACTVVLLLLIGVLVVRLRRFKKLFRPNRPARDVKPSRPNRPARGVKPSRPNRPARPQHIRPHQQHCPYLITSTSTLDFRGIL